jgi:hypothetical protein
MMEKRGKLKKQGENHSIPNLSELKKVNFVNRVPNILGSSIESIC